MVKDRRSSSGPNGDGGIHGVPEPLKEVEDASPPEDEAEERWMFVDTGFSRFLGMLEDGPGVDGLTGSRELVLSSVVRIESLNIPSREGITVQAVPSSPVPWLPLFSREARISIPLARIVWHAEVDSTAITAMRAALLAGNRGPTAVG